MEAAIFQSLPLPPLGDVIFAENFLVLHLKVFLRKFLNFRNKVQVEIFEHL